MPPPHDARRSGDVVRGLDGRVYVRGDAPGGDQIGAFFSSRALFAFAASDDSGLLCTGEYVEASDLMPSHTLSRFAKHEVEGELGWFGSRSGDSADAEQNDHTSTLAQSKLDAPPCVNGSLLNVSD